MDDPRRVAEDPLARQFSLNIEQRAGMDTALAQPLIESLTKIGMQIINFIPNLINGLIVLLIGFFLARLVRWLIATILRRVQVDALIDRTGITRSLRFLGITTPLSWLIAQMVFALLLLSFLISATTLMGLSAVARVLQQFLDLLPNLVAAVVVFLVGGMVAQFVGNLVITLAAGAGFSQASRLGRIVQFLIGFFVVVFALRALGLDTAILVTALSIMLAAFGLALGLGLGLGARGIIQHILSGYYMQQRFTVGQRIVVDQISGEISSIGTVNTEITTAAGRIIVPNSRLIETQTTIEPSTAP